MGNILIVGGSRGIGYSTSKLLSDKHNLFVASRTNENLSNLNCKYINFDALSDENISSQLPESIDGLVYCPGSINLKPFKSLKAEDFLYDFNINVIGAIKVIQSVIDKLRISESASVVLFSTVAVKIGMPFHSSVSTAKAALEGLTKSLAAEYAPKIRFNCISLSLVKTELADKFLNTDLKIEKAEQRHPLNSVGNADDIAFLIDYLLSEKSKWMSGQIIGLDGGLSNLKTN
tara:strand:- start:224 stop:919 length:696 start_codon:yes stop_codon:yes gene_type:complete